MNVKKTSLLVFICLISVGGAGAYAFSGGALDGYLENLQNKEKRDPNRISTNSIKKKLSHDNNSSSENMNIYNKTILISTGNNTNNYVTSVDERTLTAKVSQKGKSSSNTTNSDR